MDDLTITFLIKYQKITEDLIKGILQSCRFEYYPNEKRKSGYFNNELNDSVYSKSKDTAINTLIKQNGGTFFSLWLNETAFLLDIRQNDGDAGVSLSVDRVYIENIKTKDSGEIFTCNKGIRNIITICKKIAKNINPF